MARIPDSEIERLKREIPLERLVRLRHRAEAARRGTDRAVPIQPQLRCDGTGVCHLAKLSRRRQCFEH